MIDTDKYMYEEEAKKIVQDAGLIDECDGFLDVHYKSIAHLLAEVERLREVIDKEHPTFDWASRQTIANLDAEVKRLRGIEQDYKTLKGMVTEIAEEIAFCMSCEEPYNVDEGRECECCAFCQAEDGDNYDFDEYACSECREEVAAGHPSLSTWERNQ